MSKFKVIFSAFPH